MSKEETVAEIRANLKEMGRTIKGWFPPEFGFILLVVEYGDKGTMLYTASVQREDALQAMREFVAVNKEERNWQQEMPELELTEEFDAWWAKQNQRARADQSLESMCRDAFVAGRASA